jgi:hypothetical protein
MSKKTVKQEVKIETTYGTMTFKSWPEAFKFVETIASWAGFTEKTRPTSVEQAVEYHLAYVEGGFPEVRRVMRERRERERVIVEREHIRSEYGSRGCHSCHGGCIGCGGHGGLPRELWGMPPSVIEKEWARRMSMGWLGW